MKIYTKTGDTGETGLFGGQRVQKDDPRVEAYGTVDELNSFIGWCVLSCHGSNQPELAKLLTGIQSRLFEIGADLATPRTQDGEDVGEALSSVPRVTAEQVAELEKQIDAATAEIPAMTSFILPGGTELASRLHITRTVCRRAERLAVVLDHQQPIGEYVVQYLNRLSDLLFTLARKANHDAGIEDTPWRSPGKS